MVALCCGGNLGFDTLQCSMSMGIQTLTSEVSVLELQEVGLIMQSLPEGMQCVVSL